MTDPVCMGGAMTCAELAGMLEAGQLVAFTVASLLCVVLGMAFVRQLA